MSISSRYIIVGVPRTLLIALFEKDLTDNELWNIMEDSYLNREGV